MEQYLKILKDIYTNGQDKKDRTGVGIRSIFGYMFKHDLREGFPLCTTKFVSLKNICVELEFFLKGITDKKWLEDRKCFIWSSFANPEKAPYGHSEEAKSRMKSERDLGGIYGFNWVNFTHKYNGYEDRDFKGINQIKIAIDKIQKNPFDKQLIVSAWNPILLNTQALPPCHVLWHIVSDSEHLDLSFYMRSIDTFLGLPYNIASYAMLTHLVAKTVGMKPRYLVAYLDDTHIYNNHFSQVEEQLSRTPYCLPEVELPNDFTTLFDWEHDQFELKNYNHHPSIKAPIAV